MSWYGCARRNARAGSDSRLAAHWSSARAPHPRRSRRSVPPDLVNGPLSTIAAAWLPDVDVLTDRSAGVAAERI